MRRSTVVVGMGFGDEGKGTMVDRIVRDTDAELVVRFNGGAQAGHNVVVPAEEYGACRDIHHEFRQFGAGSFVPGVRTHLSRFCVVDPEMLFEEAESLGEKTGMWMWDRITVDADAPLVTPFHRSANRVRELARGSRHGSTGMGIWECESDRRRGLKVTLRDVRDLGRRGLVARLGEIQMQKRREVAPSVRALPGGEAHEHALPLYSHAEPAVLAEIYRILLDLVGLQRGLPAHETAVYEGAQGILLDESVGFHPHTTGSTCTAANALTLMAEEEERAERTVVGVTRSYSTRHGAGPFPAESDGVCFAEPHNVDGPWQQAFRQGWTDLVALRYAAACEPDLDEIAVTHMDAAGAADGWRAVTSWGLRWDGSVPLSSEEQATNSERAAHARTRLALIESPDVLLHEIRVATGLPISYISYGPTAGDKDGAGHVSIA